MQTLAQGPSAAFYHFPSFACLPVRDRVSCQLFTSTGSFLEAEQHGLTYYVLKNRWGG